MFNPIKLLNNAVHLFARGVQWDKLHTECDIMRVDAVALIRLYDHAKYLRGIIDGNASPELREAAWGAFCAALEDVER